MAVTRGAGRHRPLAAKALVSCACPRHTRCSGHQGHVYQGSPHPTALLPTPLPPTPSPAEEPKQTYTLRSSRTSAPQSHSGGVTLCQQASLPGRSRVGSSPYSAPRTPLHQSLRTQSWRRGRTFWHLTATTLPAGSPPPFSHLVLRVPEASKTAGAQLHCHPATFPEPQA